MARRRIRFATVAVFELAAFIAIAVGVTLYAGASSGWRSTQALIAQQVEAHLDALQQRLEARLRPVDEQADGIAAAFGEGRISLARSAELDAFVLGALGATPQVSDIGIVDAQGRARRWSRLRAQAIAADWSEVREVQGWLAEGRSRGLRHWRPLLWQPAERTPALLHQAPLYRDGVFVGMLGQVVPIERLSEDLAVFRAEHEVTPFVLTERDRVLGHPGLVRRAADVPGPLPTVAEVGDPVLERFLSPDGSAPLLGALRGAQAVRAKVGDVHYVYAYRELERRGAEPWTIGVYLDPVRSGQRAEMLRAVASIGAGLAVLVVAVVLAALTGRRLARPIEALARAARAVREGRLADVGALPRSRVVELDEASRSFGEMLAGLRERNLIRSTLGQYVPEQVARSLLADGGQLEPIERKATVLLCDIEGFSALTDSLGSRRIVEFLNAYFEAVVAEIERRGGVVTQFQGDAVLAVFNLPVEDPDHGANALRAALGMVAAADEREFAGVRVRNRVGISTGRVVAGAVGSGGRLSYTVHGNAVNLAARIEALNKAYGTRILLSGKTAERCPGFALRKVADARVRGYRETVDLYTPALESR
jgi:class 3 adenylate cyclase